MKAAIRINSLTLTGAGPQSLSVMEKHGKRQDKISKDRQVREVEPLVYGTLDLTAAYQKHVEGARISKGLKRPVLHALVQFPTELKITPELEQKMLDHAVRFIQRAHGGDAVFAARLDRDEEGQHTVDVFFAPKYVKRTKTGKEALWISTTKHGKELARKHEAEIRRRNEDGKFSTSPRSVGMALQSELIEYLTGLNLKIEPKNEKADPRPDRDEPEIYKMKRDLKDQKAAADRREKDLEQRQAELDQREEKLNRTQSLIQGAVKKLSAMMKVMTDKLGINFAGTFVEDLASIEKTVETRIEDLEVKRDDRPSPF